MKVKDLTLCSLLAAFTAVMAQISIPMPMGVPITMQTFAIALTGMLLGSKRGFISALLYVLLGAVGLPVYANFYGGIQVVFGPTGGFLLSFPLMAYLAGLGVEKSGVSRLAVVWGLLSGTVLNLLCGMLMFSAVMRTALTASFVACVLPFIPGGVIKAAAAGWIGVKVRARMASVL